MMNLWCSRLLTGFLICLGLPVLAQQPVTFHYRDDVKIVIDSDTIKNPWAGGFNSPVFSKIDLDGDGTEDLYVFDRTQEKSFTFLARPEKGQWRWRYAPEYEMLFPRDLGGWVLLRDYDRDGRRDLFTKTSLGIKVYRNTTGPDGRLTFTVAEPYIRFNQNINLQVSSENLPALADMDGDGDLDILTFDFSASSTIEYYQNLRVEEGLPAGSLKFILSTNRWGGLTRCAHQCHVYSFNGACRTAGIRHNDGTSLLALDLDGDQDQDLLLGADMCVDLARLTNSGTRTNGVLTAAGLQPQFPANNPARLPYYPTAYAEDVNFDGLPDLLVAPFVRSNTAEAIDFARSAWYYEQVGTAARPDFAFRQADFLQHDMVDVGEESAPALADVDADNDLDLLVGTRKGVIWFFRNVGTATRAVFKLESRDYLNLSAAGFRQVKPQFADLNRDNRPDLVLTVTDNQAGAIKYLLNTAGPRQPFRFNSAEITTLPLGQNPGDTPAFHDLDGDGDLDLLLAPILAGNGALRFYRNTGTSGKPAFTLESEAWGGIAPEFGRGRVFPLLADLNRNNRPELLLADDSGGLRYYPDVSAVGGNALTALPDLFQHPHTQAYQPARLGQFLTLATGDLDGDGKPEVLVGSRGGGLYLLGQDSGDGGGKADPPVSFRLFPNPAREWVTVESAEDVVVAVVNTAGQRVRDFKGDYQPVHTLRLSGLSPGLYLVQVLTRDGRLSGHKLVLIR